MPEPRAESGNLSNANALGLEAIVVREQIVTPGAEPTDRLKENDDTPWELPTDVGAKLPRYFSAANRTRATSATYAGTPFFSDLPTSVLN